MLNIEYYPVGAYQSNVFFVYDDQSKEAVVVDPGSEGEKIISTITELGLKVNAILLTHAHIDHVLALPEIYSFLNLKRETNIKIFLHPNELPLYQNIKKQCEMMGIAPVDLPSETFSYKKLDLDKNLFDFKPLLVPGHSPGSIALYFNKPGKLGSGNFYNNSGFDIVENFCIVGDTLFKGSIGRTDLWQGDYDQLISKIKSELFTLDHKTIIYPGHGGFSTIGLEKQSNPFFQS